jgi:Asp/Glu/hydantoin racemase
MKRLALIHTVIFLADFFKKELALRFPDLESFHILDESLLKDLMAIGVMTPSITRRAAAYARLAEEAGAGLILFTCSSTSPAVDTARLLTEVPIIKIDDPMAEKAVALGNRIGVVCTVKTTMEASRNLILAHAAERGKEVVVEAQLEEEAFEAVMKGDLDRHDRLVTETVMKAARSSDVVVLAQASMAHLAPGLNEQLNVPVLASPEICFGALGELLRD